MTTADDRMAPAGAIWVCAACGKSAKDRYGIEGEHSRGWDESCMLNAVLYREVKGFDSRGVYGWQAFNAEDSTDV